jgi:hypothetical protein
MAAWHYAGSTPGCSRGKKRLQELSGSEVGSTTGLQDYLRQLINVARDEICDEWPDESKSLRRYLRRGVQISSANPQRLLHVIATDYFSF